MANVTLKNVYKKYSNDSPNDLIAVSDFNLEIKDKEVIVFVGPSGCGKTSTLRMIAGVETISEGELYIDGKLVNDVEPKDRDIAMVYQNYALFPHMTVYENIAFGLKPTELSEEEIRVKVEEISRVTDITHLLNRKPKELSGGQKQRVALCRAFIRDNKVILLDEPLSNLDAWLRLFMRVELMRIHKKLGKTFIYVTHDQTEAMALADRLVVMKDGIIQQVGTPEEIYSHPCNVFVAGFAGFPRMNFWKSKLVEQDDGIYISWGNCQIKLPDSQINQVKGYIGKEVYVGVRPVDISDTPESIEKYKHSIFEVNVEVREFIGDKINLYCKTETDEYTASVPSSSTAKRGDKIQLAINPDKIYIFDEDTELAIVN